MLEIETRRGGLSRLARLSTLSTLSRILSSASSGWVVPRDGGRVACVSNIAPIRRRHKRSLVNLGSRPRISRCSAMTLPCFCLCVSGPRRVRLLRLVRLLHQCLAAGVSRLWADGAFTQVVAAMATYLAWGLSG